jgi:hypothetical protein
MEGGSCMDDNLEWWVRLDGFLKSALLCDIRDDDKRELVWRNVRVEFFNVVGFSL